MLKKEIITFLLCMLCAFHTQISTSQEVRVIDNKGTIKTVINNNVTYSDIEPTSPLEGDIWFDRTATPNIVKIRDNGVWRDLLSPSTRYNWSLLGNANTNSALNFLGTTDATDLVFKTNNTEELRIRNGGQILINNATPFSAHPLVIRASGNDVLAFEDSTGDPKWHWNLISNGLNFVESGEADYRLFLEVGGNVGVNTGDPTDRFHVVGTTRLEGALKDANNEAGATGQVLSSTVTGTDWIDPYLVNVVNKTANYTLTAADNGKVFTFSNAATLTVPNGLPIGFNISIYQTGTGNVTITGGATVLNRLSRFKTAGKDAGAGLVSTALNTYHLTGDLKK